MSKQNVVRKAMQGGKREPVRSKGASAVLEVPQDPAVSLLPTPYSLLPLTQDFLPHPIENCYI
ncbi:MAG: hypothetical protein F6J94_16960 [Moorea sp. SIO1F2]|uniref:hypothetical protein n=1 Tax=unclassified Moorena TaxID=2683338 RepID=UPI0013B6C01F|nr:MULTISPECIES: hypothetical protein [unclassified Moorena]NEN97474.1 hypothetical protein [Moorena sp. SIO3I7]NEO08326.1 hypothetical protein [Moorena sp. SIO3I8]NEO23936.1 hypothetical protein [Moorena sp. SIO4A5]NEP25520.1 hypothetical protein [Moorena sp. SIO3I6]NEQ59782.1 hypothetical protein [Moorena sp. SIO4A1]